MITENDMTLGMDWSDECFEGWFISEKMNGCRAYWDGRALWTRNGNKINAPAWFTDNLPRRRHLDGEIWAGRDYAGFTEARLAVQYGRFTPNIRFVVFDVPSAKGTWDKRMKKAPVCGVSYPVAFSRCRGMEDMKDRLAAILAQGGEGVMLRNPCIDFYEKGRTFNLLKVKEMPA